MQKLRVGMIGCGGIARGAHIPGYQKLDAVELVGFADISLERAREAAASYGASRARAFGDYREMLGELSLDAVSVCTPNAEHAPAAIAAMKAGCHVLCEKPMSITPEDGRRMIGAAQEHDRILTVGYNSRFSSEAQYLKTAIDAGELGNIYFARTSYLRRRGVPAKGVFLNKALQGGGPLIDIGTHALDLTMWLMGSPKPVRVVGTTYRQLARHCDYNTYAPWDPEDFEVEDSAFGHITFDNGATVILEASWALNIPENIRHTLLCGTAGGAEIGQGGLVFNEIKHGRPITWEPTGLGKANGQDGKVRDFVEAILENREPLVKGEEALAVTEILDAIYRSAASNVAVTVN